MNLGFKTKIGDQPTYFPGLILLCPEVSMESDRYEFMTVVVDKLQRAPKIHTLRDDTLDRWQPGKQIHFATGVRTPDYCQFGLGVCRSVQQVTMRLSRTKGLLVAIHPDMPGDIPHVLSEAELLAFAQNDGFETLHHFADWFMPAVKAAPRKMKTYKLIHWTSFRYPVAKRKNRRPKHAE